MRPLFCAVAFLFVGPHFAIAAGPAAIQRPTQDTTVQLIYSGDSIAAAKRMGSTELIGSRLITAAKASQKAGRPNDALGYYEAFLRFYPYGSQWDDPAHSGWDEAAISYIELIAKIEKRDEEWFVESIQAIETYRELSDAVKQSKEEDLFRLTRELIQKYPRSIFVQSAVLKVSTKSRAARTYDKPGPKLLGEMKQFGIPEANSLLVRLHCDDRSNHDKNPRQLADIVADVRQRSDSLFLRRMYCYLLLRQQVFQKEGDAVAVTWESYLEEHPPETRPSLRSKLISLYLEANWPEEALLRMESWAAADGAATTAEFLYQVGAYYGNKKDWNQAESFFKQAIRADKNSQAATLAKLGMARVFRVRNDEMAMVEILKEVAEMPSIDTHSNLMDASNSRNAAHEWLADYYTQKGKYREALLWWEKWQPASWCGTCYESMVKEREAKILECKRAMIQFDKH